MTFSCLITPLLLCLSFIISVDGQVTTSIPVGINGQLNACNAIVKFCPGGFPQSPGLSSAVFALECLIETTDQFGTYADCVDKWCKGGPNGPCDPHCCSQPNRLACIESIGSSASGTSISSIVSGLASMTSGLTATFGPCENVKHMELSCLNKDPVFAIEPMTQQAKCLCFDNNGQYAPNAFDYDASSCYESLKSAKIDHRQDFSKSSVEFCSKYVGAGPTTSSSGVSNLSSGITGKLRRH